MLMRCSLLKVLSVCTSLHSPSPSAETALTLTSYSVPASRAGRCVEVIGGMVVSRLPHKLVPLLLSCTWYREMVTLLCGAIQFTLRLGLPFLTSFDRDTPVTWEGACRSRVCRELTKQIKHHFMMCGHGSATVFQCPIGIFNEQYGKSCDTMVCNAHLERHSLLLQLTVHIYTHLSPVPACHW